VTKFKQLCTTITKQRYINEENKRRLNSRNASYHVIQNLLSSRLLSRNERIKIHEIIILPAVLYECENWVSTLTEEQRKKNRVQIFSFETKREG
jgi:hypothetical protein